MINGHVSMRKLGRKIPDNPWVGKVLIAPTLNPNRKAEINMSTEVEQELEDVSLFVENEQPRKEAVEEQPAQEQPQFEMPEKFKGKSIEDVVESYLNVEKALGNKNNEVGELRKLTDQILLNQATPATQPKFATQGDIDDDDVGFDDFIDDPSKAVEKVLKKNPRLRQLEESIEASTRETSRKALLERHEDADDVVSSPEFQKWAQESPVRLRMLQEAHVSRDVATASDLLDIYKTTRRAQTETAVDERNAIAKSDLRKATVEKGSSPSRTKPRYKRTELIHLKVTNPARYEAMRDDINKAYAEGRVK